MKNFLLFCTLITYLSASECVVLICNKSYFPKFLKTFEALTTQGCYQGDICLVIGDDLVGDEALEAVKDRVIIKHFPDLEIASKRSPYKSLFQYHKLHLFNTYFKQWDTVLYLDCGMHIFSDIRPILNLKRPQKILGHSDAYPRYFWKLRDQFHQEELAYYKLAMRFNLNGDYFQTTLLLFDTNLIQQQTFEELYRLAVEYPISRTNDQGIISLYFTQIVPVWEQIPLRNKETFFYDFQKRNESDPYIMIKYTPEELSQKFDSEKMK